MQADFHFYAVYALARAAGFSADDAHIVAYSSQHTDDAMYDHALDFRNGGRFQQILTAHKIFHHASISKKTCYRIWVPFHFLPGNVGTDFYERMVTRPGNHTMPGSPIIQRMVDDLLASKKSPYLLHRLGILLHVYADMWSHQNFLGLERKKMNDVIRMEVKGETKKSLKNLFEKLKRMGLEYAAPLLGHAQAGTIPDEPYREWSYKDYLGNPHEISNLLRSTDAAESGYRLMTDFLIRFPDFSTEKPVAWEELEGTIRGLFGTAGDIEKRCNSWKKAVARGLFGRKPEGRDMDLEYKDREWFTDAVTVDSGPYGWEEYERKPGFEKKNWKYFHDAAAYHRFMLLHEILPEQGMICG
jgi:hypothetical protein